MSEIPIKTGFSFEITKELTGALGRAGTISTPHGQIQTPAFIPR